MKKKLILVGGGEHCESCIDVIEQENIFCIAGIVDLPEKLNESVLGYKIIGTDVDLPLLVKEYNNFLVTIGHVKDPLPRIRLYNKLKELKVNLPSIISPSAYVSKYAYLGRGSIVMHHSIVDVNSKIGNNCIINHSSTIGHYANVKDHCHISANCVLGRCKINKGTFIGGNSWITNGISIASFCVIGSGSNVLKSFEEKNSIIVGNPARKIK